jgi:hypothetical protein
MPDELNWQAAVVNCGWNGTNCVLVPGVVRQFSQMFMDETPQMFTEKRKNLWKSVGYIREHL